MSLLWFPQPLSGPFVNAKVGMEDMVLVTAPDSRLLIPASPVYSFDSDLARRSHRLIELMGQEGGIGFAAPQAGWGARVFVMDRLAGRGTAAPLTLVNPVLVAYSGQQLNDEGCLSLPGRRISVLRPAQVVLRYQTVEGVFCQLELKGLAAACALHEMDHLEGRLMSQSNAWGLALPAYQDLSGKC